MNISSAQIDKHPVLVWSVALAVLVLVFMWPALFPPPGEALLGLDAHAQFLSQWNYAKASLAEGRLPLWNPYIFAGAPYLANPQIAFFYPLSWLAILPRHEVGLTWMSAIHVWLAGVGMLLFTRQQGSTWAGAGLAGIAFAFSGFTAVRLFFGHYYIAGMIAWTPWLLRAYAWSVRRGDVWSAVIAGSMLALIILSGHLATLVHIALIWGIFALYLIVSEEGHNPDTPLIKRLWRVARQGMLTGISGVALAAVIFLPALEYITESIRAAGISIAHVMPPSHLMLLIIPRFFGTTFIGETVPFVGSGHYQETIHYAGMLPVIGLGLALRRPTPRTWLYVGMIALGLLIALDDRTPVAPLLHRLIPIFNFVRAPTRAIALYLFGGSALLADAITANVPETATAARRLTTYLRIVATGSVVVLSAAVLALMRALVSRAESDGAAQLLMTNALRGWAVAAFMIVIGAGLLWALLTATHRNKRQAPFITGALALLLITDLWSYGLPALKLSPVVPPAYWPAASQLAEGRDMRLILESGDDVNVWENRVSDIGLYNAYGYDPLKPTGSNRLYLSGVLGYDPAFDLLAIQYIVIPKGEDTPPVKYTMGREVGTIGDVRLYERDTALPLVRLVYDVQLMVVSEVTIVSVRGLDPAHTVTLDADPGCEVGPLPGTPGTADITAHEPEYWRIETASVSPAILVLSETDYPGWQVSVDGLPAESMRAYSALRAVCVPAGEHIVEWRFRPRIFLIGGGINLIALVLLGAAIWRVRGRTAQEANPS